MDPVFLELPDKLSLCHKRSILLLATFPFDILKETLDLGFLVFFLKALIRVLPDTLRHDGSLRDIPLTHQPSERLENIRSTEKPIFDVFVGNLLERLRHLLVIVSRTDIRVRRADSYTSYLDITLKALYLGGVIHVAESSMLVDEALGFTVVVETTRDALPTIRKHLDSLGVPLLTPGSGGLVEKGDAFIPPLNQMLIGEGRVPVTLLGTEILGIEGVELSDENADEGTDDVSTSDASDCR